MASTDQDQAIQIQIVVPFFRDRAARTAGAAPARFMQHVHGDLGEEKVELPDHRFETLAST